MIFKKLFAPLTRQKWQSQDAEIRIKALKELSPDESKDNTILQDLAVNDASDKVRKKALEHLNDFNLWWQASKDDKNERLRKLAEDKLRLSLLGKGDVVVDETLKQQFIEQCKKGTLLEELALKDKSDQLRLTLLDKLNKNNLLQQSLQDNQTSQWLKTQIVGRLNDLPMLEKLLKKGDDNLKAILSDKIDTLKTAIEKPLQLKKDISLMLAKLNALKDKMDIEEIERKQAQFALEWQTYQDSFALLSDVQIAEFGAKYEKISTSLNNIVAPLKEKWQEQQAIKASFAEQADNKTAIAQRLSVIEVQLANAISEQSELVDVDYAGPLKQIQQDMQQLNLAQNDKNGFVQQIEQFYAKIDQIPLITECMAEASRLLTLLLSLPLPSNSEDFKEVYPTYKAWQQQWRDNHKRMGLAFPESITAAYEELNGQWQDTTKPLLKEQDQLFTQARKALSDLKYLLSSGKYRRAFGLFKKVAFLNEQLNEWQKEKLARDFDASKAKVEELADWQEYIATPRKQQLLEEMVDLAENPVDSPEEQAQKVRFTRQMWNSLGRAAEDSESALNQQFNDACEKAFEVCRTFYAEKEAIRAINLKVKEAICSKLKDTQTLLAGEVVPWQEIESTVSNIRKEWKNSGEVDRDKVAGLNQHFYGLLDPINTALRTYHEENAGLKERLLKSAESLLEEVDVFGAANQLKDLQQKWKTIGFAGGKTDSLIWRKFRKVNDQIFAKRETVKSQRDEENKQQFEQFNVQLADIEQAVLNTDDMTVLNKNHSALKELTTTLGEQPKPIQAKISPKANKLDGLIKTRKDELKEAAAKEKFVVLFKQFEQVSTHGSIDLEIESTPAWNDRFTAMPQTSDQSLRYDLTIQLEIVNEVESPVRDTDRRMELQMSLLSNKMNGGEMAQQDELLKSWIGVGRLAEDEVELLDRVKALYL